jgi:hypothetical protein
MHEASMQPLTLRVNGFEGAKKIPHVQDFF